MNRFQSLQLIYYQCYSVFSRCLSNEIKYYQVSYCNNPLNSCARHLSPVPCLARELPYENDGVARLSQTQTSQFLVSLWLCKTKSQTSANGRNFVGQQLATLFNIVGSCWVRLRVALGLCVKKYLYRKRRCLNELECVLLWLLFVIVTEGDWL